MRAGQLGHRRPPADRGHACPCRGSGTARVGSPADARRSARPACLPPCMATWASCGRARRRPAGDGGHVADGEGARGGRRSAGRARPTMRPPRPCGTPRASASGLARTPAAQIRVWAGITSPVGQTDPRGRSPDRRPWCRGGPRRLAASRVCRAWRRELGVLNGGSRSSAHLDQDDPGPVARRGRGSRGAAPRRTARPGRRPPRRPVGPPPTTTKVRAPSSISARVGVGRLEPAEHVVAEARPRRPGRRAGSRARRRPAMPKKLARRPGGDDEVVERQRRRRPSSSDRVPVPVDAGDRGLPEATRWAGAGRCPAPGRRRRPGSGPRWPPGTAAAGTCGSCCGRRW